jgi:hypothetical protein
MWLIKKPKSNKLRKQTTKSPRQRAFCCLQNTLEEERRAPHACGLQGTEDQVSAAQAAIKNPPIGGFFIAAKYFFEVRWSCFVVHRLHC